MINEILDVINRQFSGIVQDEKLFGLSALISRQRGESIERMPGIVAPDGEIRYAGVDDVHSLMVYHRINSSTITRLNNGTGDRFGDIRNVFNMSAFVYWNRNKISLQPDQMLLLLQSRLPLGMKGINDVKLVTVAPLNANMNSQQIYQQEYAAEDLRPLPFNMHIMQLNYNIESTVNPECYRQCPDCNPQ